MKDTVRIQLARRRLLSNLNTLYPTPIELRSLYRTVIELDPTYGWGKFEKDIWYLSEKGYIEFIDDALGGASDFDKKVTKLTAAGKEIAERTRSDQALEI